MAKLEMDFPEDRFYSMAGMPTSKILAILAAEQGKTINVEKANQLKEAAFCQRIQELQPIKWTMDVLQVVQVANKKIAVASGGNRDTVKQSLSAIGVADCFSIIVAAELMGVAPSECCVYEDADLGVEAARRAGMACVDIRNFHQPKRLTAPETD